MIISLSLMRWEVQSIIDKHLREKHPETKGLVVSMDVCSTTSPHEDPIIVFHYKPQPLRDPRD